MTLDRRIAALERAAPIAPLVLMMPADARTVTINGERIDRADDETADGFVARLRARRGAPIIIAAGSADDLL